jgi:protein ImuA
MKRGADKAIIEQLKNQILSLQGNKASIQQPASMDLGLVESSFPESVFSHAAVHQFVSSSFETAACTCGFISVILAKLMQQGGSCLWISTKRSIFPPALKAYGVEPSRILFIDASRAKDALWAIEESLKCTALSAVVGEISELDFDESRRLQLAVEKSQVTGFIHCYKPRPKNIVACTTRWKITPTPSEPINNMPGLGFPRWNVELQKIKNGKPGSWRVQWSPKGFEFLESKSAIIPQIHKRLAG